MSIPPVPNHDSVRNQPKFGGVFYSAGRILLFVILWGILLAPVVMWVHRDGTAEPTPIHRVILELAAAIAIIAAAFIMRRWMDKKTWAWVGFGTRSIARDSLTGLALGTAMIGLIVLVFTLAGWAEWQTTDHTAAALFLSAVALIANTITQEVLTRGYVYAVLRDRMNAQKTIILTTAFFTALHANAFRDGGILPVISIFSSGLLLAIAREKTSALYLPIGIHFAWNYVMGPVLGLAVSGQMLSNNSPLIQLRGPDLFCGGSFGPEGGIVAITVTLLAALLFPRLWGDKGGSNSIQTSR